MNFLFYILCYIDTNIKCNRHYRKKDEYLIPINYNNYNLLYLRFLIKMSLLTYLKYRCTIFIHVLHNIKN